MGSFRVAGMMAGSALSAGVEVTTCGQGTTSSWRGPELSGGQPEASALPPTLVQDASSFLSPTPRLLHPDIRLAPETACPWLGWALLRPWLWPCLETKGKDLWVRKKAGLRWDSGQHL